MGIVLENLMRLISMILGGRPTGIPIARFSRGSNKTGLHGMVCWPIINVRKDLAQGADFNRNLMTRGYSPNVYSNCWIRHGV